MQLSHALAGFVVVAGLLTIVPGLDTAIIIRSALTAGKRTAAWTTTGVCAGILVWGIAAAVGAASLLQASRIGYDIVRYLGAAYLVYLGIKMLVDVIRRPARSLPIAPDQRRTSAPAAWRSGFLTNLLNPKVGVFYIATIPQFLVPGVPPLAMGALLAAVHVLLGLTWFGLLILGASAAARWMRRPAVTRAIDSITGGVLVAFGLRTALEVDR